jgi:hypothetical protein
MTEETEVSVEAETPVGKVRGRMSGKDAHLVASVSTLIFAILILVLTWQHAVYAAQRDESQAKVLHEILQAVREGNCINSLPEAQRDAKAEWCKRITR